MHTMRPRVFINIAAATGSGPKKGLIQFLRHGGTDVCAPVVVDFRLSRKRYNNEDDDRIKGVRYEYLTQRAAYDPILIPQALRLIKRYKLNILQSHGYKSHFLCMIIKKLTGLPWIAFVHGWTAEDLKMKLYNKLDKLVLGAADRLVLVSNSLSNETKHSWIQASKVRVVHNAVDPAELSPCSKSDVRLKHKIDPGCPVAAVIGRFSPEKGHNVLVDALPAILDALPQLKLLLIGDGQERSRLQQKIEQLGLGDSVIFTGFQSELGPFYHSMDLLVLPSLSEGLPNVVLEAMLYSKPVIATRVGGVPEVVLEGETGFIVEPQSPEQLAGAVINIFQNFEQITKFGASGRQRVLEHFGPEQRVKRIAAIYEEALQ